VTGTRDFVLSSGPRCRLGACPLPLLPTYHVLTKVADAASTDDTDEEEMLVAQRMARELGEPFYDDPGRFRDPVQRDARAGAGPGHFRILAVGTALERLEG
jgi:hypothetical protein